MISLRKRLGEMVVLGSLVPLGCVAAVAQNPDATYHLSGLDGGGDVNVMAISPNYASDGRVLAGTDTGGVYESIDNGKTWHPINSGLQTKPVMKVAALAFKDASTVYLASGNYGTSVSPSQPPQGGLFVWTTGTGTWTPVTGGASLHFAGGQLDESGTHWPTGHTSRRSTGNLIAFTSTALYVGTFDDGVYKCGVDGSNCAPYGNTSGYYVRSLVADPNNAAVVYIAAIDRTVASHNGVFRVNASGPTAVTPSNASQVEELAVANGGSTTYIYAAGQDQSATPQGMIWRIQISGTTSYPSVSVASNPLEFLSVAARWDATSSAYLVLAGTLDGDSGCGSCPPTGVFSFSDSIASASTPVQATSETNKVGTSDIWWKANTPYNDTVYGLMPNSGYAAQYVGMAPTGSTAFVSGRGGPMRSVNFVAAVRGGTATDWVPSVTMLNNTFNRAVAADRGRIFVADTDWELFQSQDHAATVQQAEPVTATSPQIKYDSAAGVTVSLVSNSATSGTLFYANKAGNLYSNALTSSGTLGTAWTETGLQTAAGHSVKIYGIASSYIGSTNNIRLVVAAGFYGLYIGTYTANTATWSWSTPYCPTNCATGTFLKGAGGGTTNPNTDLPVTSTVPIILSGNYAFVYDRDHSLYRVDLTNPSASASWIAVSGTATAPLISGAETGYLALNPIGTLYWSNDNSLMGATDALNASTPFSSPTTMSGVDNNGPLAWSSYKGVLYVAGTSDGATRNAFLKSYTAPSSSLNNITDSTFTAQNAQIPGCLTVDNADGEIYMGMLGSGLFVIDPPTI